MLAGYVVWCIASRKSRRSVLKSKLCLGPPKNCGDVCQVKTTNNLSATSAETKKAKLILETIFKESDQ
jgi:hypothetical protein